MRDREIGNQEAEKKSNGQHANRKEKKEKRVNLSKKIQWHCLVQDNGDLKSLDKDPYASPNRRGFW